MPDFFMKFTGRIDRRSPRDEGDPTSPVLRENWLSRDGVLKKPLGNENVITGLSDIPRWMGRYHTIETGAVSPKTFVYTEDGKIYVLDDQLGTATEVKDLLNTNAYPRHWLFKTTNQVKLFLVDGKRLFEHDGNNDNIFNDVGVKDSDSNDFEPIDVIEHRDRLFIISNTSLKISKNLEPENFDDALDSLEVIVGSGKGTNLAFGKIKDKLYIFNTEGIFVIDGDVISALASTFEVRLIEERKIIAGRTAFKVEEAILFLADDYELWSWDGANAQMLSFELKLKDFVNKSPDMIVKATSIYHDNYYKMTFVRNAETEPNIEVWWDAFENKIDIVVGRNVSCYLKYDPTIETEIMQMGRSDQNTIVEDNRGFDYDGSAIVTKIRTRDLTIKKGFNLRYTAFYFQFQPTGIRTVIVRYLLDGRLSNPSGANAHWSQSLRGERKTLGMIEIKNQEQATGRVRPKINYSRGESIAFEITEQVKGQQSNLQGIGVDYVSKHKSKGITIGA